MKIKSFKDLTIWQRSIKLVEDIYQAMENLPKQEIYGLGSHIKKSAVSIPSNIAEGFARNYNTQYKQFLFISLGSCAELTTQLIIARNLGFINNNKADILLNEIDEISKMTMSLIKKLKISN